MLLLDLIISYKLTNFNYTCSIYNLSDNRDTIRIVFEYVICYYFGQINNSNILSWTSTKMMIVASFFLSWHTRILFTLYSTGIDIKFNLRNNHYQISSISPE